MPITGGRSFCPLNSARELDEPPEIVAHAGTVIINLGDIYLLASPQVAQQTATAILQAALAAERGESQVLTH